jgi:hypothetical protein
MTELEKESASFVSTGATKEWFDETQDGKVKIALPEADGDYMYTATRLLSWYPIVNSRGATYEKEDFDADLLGTLIGKQANLTHDKSKVIGSIFAVVANDEGIDIGVRIDREQADIHGLDEADLKEGQCFSQVSVELTKDPSESVFYAYDDEFNVLRQIPVLKGRNQGIRRTTEADPYRLQGHRVAERIKPARFTGVGFVPNPADKTAKLYAVAASDDAEDTPKAVPEPAKKRAESHTQASSDAVTKETTMSDEEIKAIQTKVAELEAQVQEMNAQRETAAAEVAGGAAKIAALEAQLTEIAAERDALKSEKEVAAREARIDALLAELEAIRPAKDDEARVALREKAAMACDDNGTIHVLKLELENEALKAKLDEAVAASAVNADAVAAADAAVAAAAAETAAAEEKETFSAVTPAVSIAPVYEAKPTTDKNWADCF